MLNLQVKIGKAKFPNPVTVASGTFGYNKYSSLKEVRQLGAFVPKTITLNKREGNPPQRITETPSGMVNAIGIENSGVEDFIANKLPQYVKLKVPVIVSISANSAKEFQAVIRHLNKAKGVAAIELNLSCPNLKHKVLVAQDAKLTAAVVRAAKRVSRYPVIAKLTPNVTDIAVIAKAAEKTGADAISLINTLSAMVIDVKTRRSVIGNVTGGLSGPAIRPVAVFMTRRVYRAVKIPIIAMGGIMTAEDALQFILAGASMVAVGTANFINPQAPKEVLRGIKDYLRTNKIKNYRKLIGALEP